MPAWAANWGLGLAAGLAAGLTLAAPARGQVVDLVSKTELRVCADPANPPFSRRGGGGFENEIADLLAAALDKPAAYTWFPMTIGFIRRTLRANRCDVVIGYAQGHELVLNTNHFYTSTYVLVARPGGSLAAVDHLGDPALRGRRLGVIAGSPPASHLVRLGLMAAARPYRLMVDRRVESPAEQMIADLRAGRIDGGLLWGPVGGYWGRRHGLKVTPLLKERVAPRLFYRITMGVRPGELVWKRRLNRFIRRHQAAIDRILVSYGVPLLNDQGTALKPVPK